MSKKNINTIDLFAGCGGLLDGFMLAGGYNSLACVEWEKYPCATLSHRLKTKWGHTNADNEVVRFDIQRTDELFNGFDDAEYGSHIGLNALIGKHKVDVIIGGPPCQAYSIAGRVRDVNGMRDDYRNYLFESYLKVVSHYKPKFFIFENVVGMLSAAPDGTPIVNKIKDAFDSAGYAVVDDFKTALFDVADFGIPQHRQRVIILGVNKSYFGKEDQVAPQKIIKEFYESLASKRGITKTVRDAIGDLPVLRPNNAILKLEGKKYSHSPISSEGILNHTPRFHSERDIKVFKLLTEDIASGQNKYITTAALKNLYTTITGKVSNIHKFYVLRWYEPSNTIPAHLYKDGLRHIHPDPQQARSITVREAARLQTFADDFEFLGPMMAQYKMIGNAVPSAFATIIANVLKSIFNKYC